MFALAHDITLRQRMEADLARSLSKLESTIEGTNAGTWEWNVQTGETSFNSIWAKIIGYSLEELAPISIKTWERIVHPEDAKISQEALERHFSGELEAYDCECRIRHKDGRWIWVHDRGKVTSRDEEGRPLMMYGTHTDISERKQSEAMIKETLDQNQDLLHELQHRAKNSFAMITSLVNLMASRTDILEARSLLEELEGRVRTISQLYSLLYSTRSSDKVWLDSYCTQVVNALAVFSGSVSVTTEIEAIEVKAKIGAPLALILTELLTNVFKYAFPDHQSGQVLISLERREGGARLSVRDNGIGLPPGFDPSRQSGLGLELVIGLSGQIKGDFTMEGDGSGTLAKVNFPIG